MNKSKNTLYKATVPLYYPIEVSPTSLSTPNNINHNSPPIRTSTKPTTINNLTNSLPPSNKFELETLQRANEELRDREEIYIDKLMTLEDGLERQHREFINLQQLYTELFESYKHKESKIVELELRYRETERDREGIRCRSNSNVEIDSINHNDSKAAWKTKEGIIPIRMGNQPQFEYEIARLQKQYNDHMKEWQNKEIMLNQTIVTLKEQLTKLILDQEKANQELKTLKIVQNIQSESKEPKKLKENWEKEVSKLEEFSNRKTIQKELDDYEHLLRQEKELSMKLQYENEFLKARNEDLEAAKKQIEQILELKQKEVTKLREEKINAHRMSAEKVSRCSLSRGKDSSVLSISGVRSDDSVEAKSESNSLTIKPRKQEQTTQLSEPKKEPKQHSIDSKQPTEQKQPQLNRINETTHLQPLQTDFPSSLPNQFPRNLQQTSFLPPTNTNYEQYISSSSHESHESSSSLPIPYDHYFSFSKDKPESSMDSDLPTFPPELEIESLIHEHCKDKDIRPSEH